MFYLYFSDECFEGDLRKCHLVEANEVVNVPHDYRGPFALRRDAMRTAETLCWVAVGRNLERLMQEPPTRLENLKVVGLPTEQIELEPTDF